MTRNSAGLGIELTCRLHGPSIPESSRSSTAETAAAGRSRRISDRLAHTRAKFWRYPPGTRGKRHAERLQEEVFVVLEGNAAIDLGDPAERHELPRGSVCVVQPGTPLQLRNDGDEDVLFFIVGAPPEEGGADYFPDVD
jgi:mannose-6-phosphate isomerase-like protein (cupin superfamily)